MSSNFKCYRHFWYSERYEIRHYEAYAQALEFGMLSTHDVPRWNTCRVSIAGEELTLRYNLCSDMGDSYESIPDLVYLGVGELVESRAMRHSEICQRARELDMILPSVLSR